MSLVEAYAEAIVNLKKVCPTVAIVVPYPVFRAFIIEMNEEAVKNKGKPSAFNAEYERTIDRDREEREILTIEGVEIRAWDAA